MKRNEGIRATARQKGGYLHEIADVLGVSGPTFIRWLRKELPESKKSDVRAPIDIVAEQRKESAND